MRGIKKLLYAVIFGIAVSLLTYFVSQTVGYRPFLRLQNSIDDSHFAIWKKRIPPNGNTVIVDIDDSSLEALGNFTRWPRRHFGSVIERVNADGARMVFLDIILMEGGSSNDNLSLAASVRNAGDVILGYYFTLDSRSRRKRPADPVYNDRFAEEWLGAPGSGRNEFIRAKGIALPFQELAEPLERMGFTNYIPDPDGILRHIPLLITWNHKLLPSASFQMWMLGKGYQMDDVRITDREIRLGDTVIPTDSHGFMRLNFRDTGHLHPTVSFRDALAGTFPPGTFTGKVVMIGSSSKRLGDLKKVPGHASLPGVEIHAAALSTLLDCRFITVISGNTIFVFTVLCGILASLLFTCWPTVTVGIPAALAAPLVLYVYSVYCFVFHSELFNISIPSISILLIALATTVHHFVDRHERSHGGHGEPDRSRGETSSPARS